MLGKYKLNQIYNEDCYEALKNIPDKSVDLIYVDVPYLYDAAGNVGTDKSAVSQRIARVRNEYLKNISDGIDYKILNEFCRIMKRIYIYIWCSKKQILDFLKYFVDGKKCNFEILTWNKTNPTPATNNTYLPDIEYCLMFRENGCILNDGYELKSKWYVSPINKGDKDLYDHPTIKPLELVKRHILHSTQPNDIVLDCFLGSGTTCVAAKETGRRYIGFEIEPTYYKIAQDRLNNISQQTRKQIESGQMTIFDMLEN